ncbi:MAG: NAD-dependent epimerase/dehydratase family protein [Deltaproteobacteria bacterium]|nr:MAG: NAD-dependent epimerase/dehydratase family protein [Deltaproteobacteria bacterium]
MGMGRDVLVLGSNGFIGLHAVDGLRAVGIEPRCGRRARSNILGLRSRKAQMVRADLDAPDTLRTAMAGCGTVLHIAGHYPRTSHDPEGSVALGLRQLDAALDAAAAAGVRRFIYVSSTATVAPAPGGGPADESCVFAECPDFGTYHRLKWAMEQRVAAETRMETATVCPAGCLGPGDLRVGTSALVLALVAGGDPPHPDGVVSLVDVRDVGVALGRLCVAETLPPRLLLSGGSHRLQPLLERIADRYGVAPPSSPLPAAEAVARADAAERKALATGRRPTMSREIVDLIIHGVPIDASRAARLLDLRWTPLDRTIDDLVAWARRMRLLPPAPSSPTASPSVPLQESRP